VNVASRCGFTNQYRYLEVLYQAYQAQGFEILAFPCNQFAKQEPEDMPGILKFVSSCFRVTFPIFAKVEVRGSNQAPIYRYLTNNLKQRLLMPMIPWNFTKFLVNREGQVIHRFLPIAPKWYLEQWIKRTIG
jgi:glutathione peroxidase